MGGDLTMDKLGEVDVMELERAPYYNGHVKVAGRVRALHPSEGRMDFVLTGTQSERIMEAFGGGQDRAVSVHLCQSLGADVEAELVRFVSLCPLAFMNFRLPVSEFVTASDASTSGGGLCVSRGVSPYGLAASQAEARGDVLCHEIAQVLVISLFGGIGALRVALDTLKVPVAGYISVEIDDFASRVVESFFPEVVRVQDVAHVNLEMVAEWSMRFASVSLVVLGAGPPCQGVSGLNADRKGAMRDARSCLFQQVPRIEEMVRRVFRWCPVYRLIENVASMDKEDRAAMHAAYRVEPWLVDAGGITLARRPRLYW